MSPLEVKQPTISDAQLLARVNAAAHLMERVQVITYQRRIRIRDVFRDYDPRRSGRVTVAQFIRGLRLTGINFLEDEAMALAREYVQEDGAGLSPRQETLQFVNYDLFCQHVDEVFSSGPALGASMGSSGGQPSPRSPAKSPKAQSGSAWFQATQALPRDDETFNSILSRVAKLCRTRGVIFKTPFQEFDHAIGPAQTHVTPRLSGKVTIPQFRRLFPFKRDFNEEEIEVLLERYVTDSGHVHFGALHNDVSEAMNNEPVPLLTSGLILRPDGYSWTHDTLSPIDKIRSKIVERRVRLLEHFQDFDVLRKGVCTAGQVKSVFTILAIGKELDRMEFERLVHAYLREDGMFKYADFCKDVDKAFVTAGLEKDPLLSSRLPDPTSTAPARRNRMVLPEMALGKVAELEERLRKRVAQRRAYLRPAFQDMDRSNRGHVTKSQFQRVLSMLGFELDAEAVELLTIMYCDLGNRREINYLAFCASCDATDLGIDGNGNVGGSTMPFGPPPLSVAQVPSLAAFQKQRPAVPGAPHSARFVKEPPFNMFSHKLDALEPQSARQPESRQIPSEAPPMLVS
eukprot:TRINITY_DN32475_c0_g1_i1.p1 TRINITY_DN32475_c0_g1~~TRINITY_DN32475_c0_g1_i1.p1  ORF type:complete len:572 (-),score=144.80 TRINITY_DN32475_c0_g1_i1:132-1847(-)